MAALPFINQKGTWRDQPKNNSSVWRQTQPWNTIVTAIILDLDRECVVRLLKSHRIMINYFRTGVALEVQRKKKTFNTCTFLLANSYASQ